MTSSHHALSAPYKETLRVRYPSRLLASPCGRGTSPREHRAGSDCDEGQAGEEQTRERERRRRQHSGAGAELTGRVAAVRRLIAGRIATDALGAEGRGALAPIGAGLAEGEWCRRWRDARLVTSVIEGRA